MFNFALRVESPLNSGPLKTNRLGLNDPFLTYSTRPWSTFVESFINDSIYLVILKE